MAARKSINITINGVDFLNTNYVPILDKADAPEAFHMVQDFLRTCELQHALQEPALINAHCVHHFWTTADYNGAGETERPVLTFRHNDTTLEVTPDTVRQALALPHHDAYAENASSDVIRQFLTSLGYAGPLTHLGKLNRKFLRKEWRFFFDSIGRAFTAKCSNFDALTIPVQQIGYSLIFDRPIDIASYILRTIGYHMLENRTQIYYPRFVHLIYNLLCPNDSNNNVVVIPALKLSKRQFTDMVNKDAKQGHQLQDIHYPWMFLNKLYQRIPSVYSDDLATGVNDQNLGNPTDHNPDFSPLIHSPIQQPTSVVSQQTSVVPLQESAQSDVHIASSGLGTSSEPHTSPMEQGDKTPIPSPIPSPPHPKRRRLVRIAETESEDEDNLTLSSVFPGLSSDPKISSDPAPQAKHGSSTGTVELPPPELRLFSRQKKRKLPSQDASDQPGSYKDDAPVNAPVLQMVVFTPVQQKDQASQEPCSQSEQAATSDPVPQEPPSQSLGADISTAAEQQQEDIQSMELSTQEPPVFISDPSGAAVNVPAPQEPTIQSIVAGTSEPELMHHPLNLSIQETSISGILSENFMLQPVGMIMDKPSSEDSPIHMTTDIPSQPPLISVGLSVLSPFSEPERKETERTIERQTPDLAKGEVEMRKDLANPSEQTVTLKSPVHERVSSAEITEKEKRDLGVTGSPQISKSGSDSATSSSNDAPAPVSDKLYRQDFSSQAKQRQAAAVLARKSAFASSTWKHGWSNSIASISINDAYDCAAEAIQAFSTDELHLNLKSTTLLVKGLHQEIKTVSDHTNSKLERMDIAVQTSTMRQATASKSLTKKVDDLTTKVYNLERQVNSMDSKLDAILALLNSDVKKGEKVSQDKCRADLVLQRKDDTDREERGQSGAPSSQPPQRKDKGKGVMIETGKSTPQGGQQMQGKQKELYLAPPANVDISKFMQTVLIDGKETEIFYKDDRLRQLDAETAKKIFEEENPGVDYVKEIQRAEAYFARQKERNQNKGRGKGKTPVITKKQTQIESVKEVPPPEKADTRSTASKQEISKISGKSRKDTKEPTQFVKSSMASAGEASKKTDTEPLWSKFAKDQPKALAPFTKGGLGHKYAEYDTRVEASLKDPFSLKDNPNEELSQKHLNKVISAQLVVDSFDGNTSKEKLIYFLQNGWHLELKEEDMLHQSAEQLEYILYLLKGKDEKTERWKSLLKTIIHNQRKKESMMRGKKFISTEYIPKYIAIDNSEKKMKPNSAKLEKVLGTSKLVFNKGEKESGFITLDDMSNASISNLRAGIYQLGNLDQEIKNKLEQALNSAEETLLNDFLKDRFGFKKI